MNPLDPLEAQQIVVDYARMLERDIAEQRHPGRIDALPYSKPTIKVAIQTSLAELARSGQLTAELRDYFETAYTCLAEYLDNELVELMTAYRQSAEQLAAEAVLAQDKARSAAWRTLVESGSLAGEVARTAAAEAGELKKEFAGFVTAL
jgi:hypothetical protein